MLRLILILFVLIFYTGCGSEVEKKTEPAKVNAPVKETELTTITLTPKAEQRLGIRLYTITKKQVTEMRVLGGDVQAIPGQATTIVAPLQGTLLLPGGNFIPLAGTMVKKGQVLYRLVLLPGERDLLSAKDEMSMREVQLETARSKMKRMEQLLIDGAVSVKQTEEAKAELAAAEQAFKDVKARYSLLTNGSTGSSPGDHATYNIESPVDGIILKVHSGTSQALTAGTPIADISALSPVWVRVPVYMGDLQSIDLSREVNIQSLSDTKGEKIRIAKPVSLPVSSGGSSLTDIFFELPNEDKIFYPGEKVNVTLPLSSTTSSLAVPYSAIVYDFNGGQWLYVNTSPHVYTRQRVEVHHVIDSMAVITRGVDEGMKVVTAGAAELFGTEFGGGK